MRYTPDKVSLDSRPTPAWYRDAKLGIFVHWGLYSIPAFSERTNGDLAAYMRDLAAMKDTAGATPYAEWYLNALRVPRSATARHHQATYGPGFSYFDFRRQFAANATEVDLEEWAAFFARVGARYVVMVTKHLDGYPLWPTNVRNPNMPADYRSSRDLVGDLTAAVRARGLRMGLYYTGGVDWTFTQRPMRTMTDLMASQALGPTYARYAEAQWRELIATYRPSILWNDMGWPAESDPHTLFADYYETVEDGLVNDRWRSVKLPRSGLARAVTLRMTGVVLRLMARSGRALPVPASTFHYDIETHEYESPTAAIEHPWELTRGLGNSFGYNAQETKADTMSGEDLVHLLVDVVSRGGNLLINVGPDGRGQIPELQRTPLSELGDWLDSNGEAIFETRPWSQTETTTADGHPVRFTEKEGAVYVIVLADRLPEKIVIRNLTAPPDSRLRLLGDSRDLAWSHAGDDMRISLPPRPLQHAHVLAMEGRHAGAGDRSNPSAEAA
jgi:alpha-L-fucosidase